jgi:hypothetical protein
MVVMVLTAINCIAKNTRKSFDNSSDCAILESLNQPATSNGMEAMMSNLSANDYEIRYALDNIGGSVAQLREHFERMAKELASYETRIHEAAGSNDLKGVAKVCEFVLHNVSTNNGPRLDLLASGMARLCMAITVDSFTKE